jgi:Helicase conserved C-terminal domain
MTSTLTEHLRALTDDGLGALLRARPDLVVPPVSDLAALASRVNGRASVARALDGLDQFTLEVLDGLRLVRGPDGSAAVETLYAMAAEQGTEARVVQQAVQRLRDLCLVVGPDAAVKLAPAVDELTSPYPAGLGRPADELDPDVAMLVEDAAGLRRMLLSAPPEARAVLDRLAAGPPVGTVTPSTLRGADGRSASSRAGVDGRSASSRAEDSPVRWLVDHQLLVAVANDTVELPREIGIVLRRESGPLGPLHPEPPEVAGQQKGGADQAGAGQALEAVRHLEALLHALADSPATVLRSFGLGVRDLRRLARDTGTGETVAALLLEIAEAAGLLTYSERGQDMEWLPTPAFDTWRNGNLASRWVLMARTWLLMTRAPALIGQRDDKDKPISALSHEASRASAPQIRRTTLAVLADLAPGTAASADAVVERLIWQAPRRAGRAGAIAGPQAMARATLSEAAALGVTGLDALTSYGRVLLAESTRDHDDDPLGIHRDSAYRDRLTAAVDALLPVPVDHVLVQADLTVVVPGPPEPVLAGELALVADAESRGGATVYRVTPSSVRRALDAGYTAADVHGLFQRRSRTPLPQALQYLVDDVARRHGGLRVGTAGAYLRSDDEALISEVFADRRLSALSLRRLAPTVLTTPLTTVRLLEMLRATGYAPVPEDATGAAVLTRPTAARGPARPAPRMGRLEDPAAQLTAPRLAGIVEQIRLGDRLARATRRSPLPRNLVDADGTPLSSSQAHTQALAVLQQAMREQVRVWVGYVDAHGSLASKLVRPVSMGAGYLRAEDDRSEMMHTFALHRITSAVLDEA